MKKILQAHSPAPEALQTRHPTHKQEKTIVYPQSPAPAAPNDTPNTTVRPPNAAADAASDAPTPSGVY